MAVANMNMTTAGRNGVITMTMMTTSQTTKVSTTSWMLSTQVIISKSWLVDLGGRELGKDTELDLDNVIQEDEDLFPEDPDSEDYEGYMGNSVSFHLLILLQVCCSTWVLTTNRDLKQHIGTEHL